MRSAGAPPRLWTASFALAVAGTLAMFLGFFLLLPTLPPYATSLGASNGEVGILVAAFTIAAAITRVSAAPAMDRRGPKRGLLLGLVLIVVATASYAAASSVSALLALRVVQGVGWGLSTTGFGTLVARLAPPLRRGEAIGWWGMAPTVALALSPPSGGILAARFGFETVFVVSAVVAAAGLLVVAPIASPRDEGAAGRAGRFFRPPPGTLLPAGTLFLASLAYGALTAFLPVELADRPGVAGSFFAVFGLAILASRPFTGRLSDRVGRPALVVPGLAMGVVGTVLVGFAHDPPALFAAAVLLGIGIGGATFPVLMAHAIDRAPLHARGAAMATYMTAYDAAIAIGAGGLGPLYDGAGFLWMNVVAAAFMALGLLVFMVGTRRAAGGAEA